MMRRWSERRPKNNPGSNRRGFLCRFIRLLAAPVAVIPFVPRLGHTADRTEPRLRQPQPAEPSEFMRRAYAMKELAVTTGDQAFGAVVTKQGLVVGQAPSRVIVNRDPTAHAEMEAVRDAARRLGTHDLSGCVLYSSSRPCPMCEAAAYWAGLERLVYGTALNDGGRPRLRRC